MKRLFLMIMVFLLPVIISSCGGPSSTTGTGTTGGGGTTTYTIGGSVSGLDINKSVTLTNNSGDDLTVNNNGLFTFAAPLENGATYNVGISAQPDGQTCSVLNNSGTINGSDVKTVSVECIGTSIGANYSVGGTVEGLKEITDKVILKIDDGNGNTLDSVTVSYDSTYADANPVSPVPFVFQKPFSNGDSYKVTVGSASNGKNCEFYDSDSSSANGTTSVSGTIKDADVVNIYVKCN